MKIFHDQLERKVELRQIPKRIVSLVPSQTELLVDLGLEERIMGVTKFCVHPGYLRKKKKIVGGTKKVHFDRIKALAPDIILCNKEENTEDMVRELEQIAPVHVSDVKSIDDALQLIEQYGDLFDVGHKALEIAGEIRLERKRFEEYVKTFPERKVAYFIWKDPWMVAGEDTFIDHLLELNRFKNVFANGDSRYPEIELDQLKQKEVELVLLSTEPYPFKSTDKEILKKEVRMDCIQIVDGEFFSWYGSRLTVAFTYFRKLHAIFP